MTVNDKQAGASKQANFLTDENNFAGHMFNKKLEEKSYKMSFKALPVKIQQSKNRQGGGSTMCHHLEVDRFKRQYQKNYIN